jgi:glycosyltransferase involved in cell wall biosynthesis
MPISRKRLVELELAKARFTSTRDVSTPLVIQFIGSVYSPRDQFLKVVQEKLAVKGIDLRINSDKAGTSNDDYWRVLVESDIILTTTLQGPTRGFMDWIWVRQAVFRYAETMAAGTALVAQCVEGGFPYFTKDSDYLEFNGVDQAVAELAALASDSDLRSRIAESGHATIAGYVQESIFWKDVMKCCQPD